MSYKIDAYHDSAHQYVDAVVVRETVGIERDPIMPRFLQLIGDVSDLTVLDAGCGSGYISHILEDRGARVTGIDITDYFDTGKAFPYPGMVEHGIKVHFYHHTLEEYINACSSAGLQLQRLVDVPTPEGTFKRRPDTLIQEGHHFPFFMILGLVKSE